jgi:hypothetical protein
VVASDLLNDFLERMTAKPARMIAARGLAPLPPKETLQLLTHLAHDADPDVASEAVRSLEAWSEDELVEQLHAPDCPAQVLEHFAQGDRSARIREAIAINPATPPQTVADLAARAPADLLESILYNRVRLLAHPAILDRARLNPALTAQLRGLIQEIQAEFFSGKKQEYTLRGESEPQTSAPSSDAWEGEPLPPDLSLEGLPVDPEEREAALLDRLARLTVRQKIQLALLGTREARALLIRDVNKEVARSVLHSPKLSDNEVAAFAAMRNVSEEILREIGAHKSWTRTYGVVQNLVRNPKTPSATSQRLLFRLQSKDLLLLSRDRGIPEAVRRNAQRALNQRNGARPGA